MPARSKAKPTRAKAAKRNERPRSANSGVDPRRFVRAAPGSGTSSAGSWQPPKGVVRRSNNVTEFLGRLWALFGPPTGDNAKGFEYDIHDTVTGEVLSAYSGASGPSFGTVRGVRSASVDALEALINATTPVDCKATVDYGATEIGIANGKHFYDYQGPDDDSFGD